MTSELDAKVARVEGWRLLPSEDDPHVTHYVGERVPSRWVLGNHTIHGATPPAYSTDPALWGPLIEKYHMAVGRVSPEQEDYPDMPVSNLWFATPIAHKYLDKMLPAYDESLGIAVCLAVLAAQGGSDA